MPDSSPITPSAGDGAPTVTVARAKVEFIPDSEALERFQRSFEEWIDKAGERLTAALRGALASAGERLDGLEARLANVSQSATNPPAAPTSVPAATPEAPHADTATQMFAAVARVEDQLKEIKDSVEVMAGSKVFQEQ